MLLAVSIVTGFRREIRAKVAGFNSHIVISSAASSSVLRLSPALDSIVSHTPGITSYSLSLSVPSLLKTPQAFSGLSLKSMPAPADTAFLSSCIVAGSMPGANAREVLISQATAHELSLAPGDSVNLYYIAEDIAARKLKVSGIYNSHFENYDRRLAYAPLPLVQNLSKLPASEGTAIEITTDDIDAIPAVADNLFEALNNGVLSGKIADGFTVTTLQEKGANFFAWLDLLDTNVIIILVLMTLVALFTLISGLLIIILEKVRFIGVMKAIGADSARLRKIFVLMATRIGLRGLIIGNLLALAIIGVQTLWHPLRLNADAYYIDYVPVSLPVAAWLAVNVVFIAIIYLVLIIPARFVSRISPAESMRFAD